MDTLSELDDETTMAFYGTDVATVLREAPGVSAFDLEDGVVTTYIRTTPERLWQALTDRALTKR